MAKFWKSATSGEFLTLGDGDFMTDDDDCCCGGVACDDVEAGWTTATVTLPSSITGGVGFSCAFPNYATCQVDGYSDGFDLADNSTTGNVVINKIISDRCGVGFGMSCIGGTTLRMVVSVYHTRNDLLIDGDEYETRFLHEQGTDFQLGVTYMLPYLLITGPDYPPNFCNPCGCQFGPGDEVEVILS